MSGRAASWLAWSACAFSLALTALTVLLIVLLLRSDAAIYYYWLETSMVAVGYSTVGAIVASRLPESPIGWLFCAIGLIFGVSHFSAEYAAYDLLGSSESLPAGEAFAWLTSWVWVFGLGLIVFLDLLFPNGRQPSARWRWFARFTAIMLLPAAILAALSPGLILSSTLQNPLGIEGLPNQGDRGVHVRARRGWCIFDAGAAASRGENRAPADQVVRLRYRSGNKRGHPQEHHLHGGGRNVGMVGGLGPHNGGCREQPCCDGDSDLPLPTLPDRHPDQPHSSLRPTDGGAGRRVSRWGSVPTVRLPIAH